MFEKILKKITIGLESPGLGLVCCVFGKHQSFFLYALGRKKWKLGERQH